MTAMNYHKGNLGLANPKLLSTMMLVVLAVSIMLAWAMVRGRGEPVRNAAAILEEIQSNTLSSYWPAKGIQQWYIGTDMADNPLGWYGLAVTKEDDGFKYIQIQTIKDQQFITICMISSDGSTEKIESTTRKKLGRGAISIVTTSNARVNYASDRIEAWASGAGDMAVINAPSNYIPWSLTEIAAQIVNQTQQVATFKSILLQQPVYHRQVVLEQLTMTPQEDNSVLCEGQAIGGKTSLIYFLDSAGLINKFDLPTAGISFKRVTFEELAKIFPAVMGYRAATTTLSDKPERPDQEN